MNDFRKKMKKWSPEKILIYEEDDFIIVNKPADVASVADWTGKQNLLEIVRSKWPEAQACHRLDKETSGIMIFARNKEAMRTISMQFQERVIQKEYHAIVKGNPDFNDFSVDVPIRLASERVFVDMQEGKKSETIFTTMKQYKQYALLACFPKTGRMHQIRMHLSWVKFPIVGDVKYGGAPFYLSSIKAKYNLGKYEEEKPLMRRVALHARGIAFKDVKGEVRRFEADYPKDMRAFLNQLDKFGDF